MRKGGLQEVFIFMLIKIKVFLSMASQQFLAGEAGLLGN